MTIKSLNRKIKIIWMIKPIFDKHKLQMNWFAGQKLRHRCREQTYGHQGGKVVGGGGVMNWSIGIDVYTDVYKTDD